MKDIRVMQLFSNALDWIYDHTEAFHGEQEYIRALKHIGMTDEEIREVVEEGWPRKEIGT